MIVSWTTLDQNVIQIRLGYVSGWRDVHYKNTPHVARPPSCVPTRVVLSSKSNLRTTLPSTGKEQEIRETTSLLKLLIIFYKEPDSSRSRTLVLAVTLIPLIFPSFEKS
jgi:hypothetical protein